MTDAIQNVFISSTMADLEAYRREVKDSLELIPASAFLSEDWVCTHGSTETVCKEKFGCLSWHFRALVWIRSTR
jgi:hypothetical protein